ncbi:DinB family protein [Aquibacillus rhizosphaerae]|uniref:DinB family protein n=1 Tax=Aquibacillus rhizosphaerae TaxID=3051431 RepID=A0ABT7L984_9BACI|nr:DinB family protein [Aquibacillus sp. LR5S19]MDL4842424.1 DinB family protein [Aquibacillus sp. LR5S19]
MNTNELILEQFRACHSKNTWFVSLKTALGGLSSKQASNKCENSTNSIREIVEHLNFYNQLELTRFKSLPDNVSVLDNNDTFNHSQETSWDVLVEELLNTMGEWENEIGSCDEKYIEKFIESLTYINLHNAYHIGQIIYIRKSLGLWDKSQGINYTF